MSTPRITSFTSYNLTAEEYTSGTILSVLQVQVIQNLICDTAEAKIALTFDTANPQSFIQKEAELQGQIGILKHLLALSEESIQQANQVAQSQGE